MLVLILKASFWFSTSVTNFYFLHTSCFTSISGLLCCSVVGCNFAYLDFLDTCMIYSRLPHILEFLLFYGVLLHFSGHDS